MATRVYLVRNAATVWTAERRVTGRRDIGLSPEGEAQANALAERMAGLQVAEILSSPLPRAVSTAERLAARLGVDVARDPRLQDFDAGSWQGLAAAEVASQPAYQALLGDLTGASAPGGTERPVEVRDRMVASIRQALSDNEVDDTLVVVSHATPLRLALAQMFGMDLRAAFRLHLAPASVSLLEFDSDQAAPRLLGLNLSGPLP